MCFYCKKLPTKDWSSISIRYKHNRSRWGETFTSEIVYIIVHTKCLRKFHIFVPEKRSNSDRCRSCGHVFRIDEKHILISSGRSLHLCEKCFLKYIVDNRVRRLFKLLFNGI